jgi:hypothetical protein
MSSSGRSGRPSGRSSLRHGSPLADEQFAREDLQSLTLKRYARGVAAVILVSVVVVNLVTIAAGPTLAPEELAGRKLLALFDQAAARDFADVRLLARRFGKNVLLARAAQIDAGFDTGTLASMIATLDRFADDEIPVPEGSSAAELRAFYAEWRSELMKLSEG